MASLAAAGKVPGKTRADFFRGDRLYTRGEIARFIADIFPEELTPSQRLALSVLARRFHPELRLIDAQIEASLSGGGGGEFAMGVSGAIPVERDGRIVGTRASYTDAPPTPKGPGFLTAQVKGRLLTDPEAGEVIGRAAGLLPVGRDGFAAVMAGNYRDEWHTGRFTSLGAGPVQRGYPAVETLLLHVDGRALNVTIGAQPLWWGPGYAGALTFSDEAPSVPMVKVDKGFQFGGWFGERIGRLHFTQFLSTFREDDIPAAVENARGTRRYLAGRRLETEGHGPWHFSFSEVFKSTRLPDPWAAVLLPFYTYQNDWTGSNSGRWFGFLASDPQPNTFWMNYMVDVQVVFRPRGGGDAGQRPAFYADLLIDDIQAPEGLGEGNDVPRKIGWQVGVFAPDLGGNGKYAGRLEYATIDATTYTNFSPPITWTRDSLPLGHPAGPNAKVLFGRLDAALTPKVNVAVEAAQRRRNSSSGPEANADRLGVYATYAVDNNAFVGARVEHRRISPQGAARDSRTRFEVNAGIGF